MYGSKENPAPVISLTVQNKDDDVLVGVRDPKTNPTHPNVVSTPTMRLPKWLMDSIIRRYDKIPIERPGENFPEQIDEAYKILSKYSLFTREEDTCCDPYVGDVDPLVYAVEGLLARKLGLADKLILGKAAFIAKPTTLLKGKVLYEYSDKVNVGQEVEIDGEKFFEEYIDMCGLEVRFFNPDIIPESTHSYSELHWMTKEQFRDLTELRSPFLLPDVFGNKGVDYCTHGMCILSAYSHVQHMEEE